MPAELPIRAIVNDTAVSVAVPAHRMLSSFLREDLGLTGTKESCALEICGTCTVLVDGEPVSSCSMLAADIDGRDVLTVEGLSGTSDGELHPLQRAFIERSAMQCGYCTPGFLMTATALLRRNPDPDEATILHELHGNICRCTGYLPIVEAVQDAARVIRGDGGR